MQCFLLSKFLFAEMSKPFHGNNVSNSAPGLEKSSSGRARQSEAVGWDKQTGCCHVWDPGEPENSRNAAVQPLSHFCAPPSVQQLRKTSKGHCGVSWANPGETGKNLVRASHGIRSSSHWWARFLQCLASNPTWRQVLLLFFMLLISNSE